MLIESFKELKTATIPPHTYWWVASPYSKYPFGIDAAWETVCLATGTLIKAGVKVYSPIAHTHPIAVHAKLDPYDHDIWLPAALPLMLASGGLLVLRMSGWSSSFGISEEIKVFDAANKPVRHVQWPFLDRYYND